MKQIKDQTLTPRLSLLKAPILIETTKTIITSDKKKKIYSYKHPGHVEGSKKSKYEDVDQYFECPECGGTINNYSWRCYLCRFSGTVYNPIEEGSKFNPKNFVNKAQTLELRKNLRRINPWTGEDYNPKSNG